jgi:hypothetical protein
MSMSNRPRSWSGGGCGLPVAGERRPRRPVGCLCGQAKDTGGHAMLKFLGSTVGIIFIIGLLVVIGLLALVF